MTEPTTTLTYADVLARVEPVVAANPTNAPACSYFQVIEGPDGDPVLGAPVCVVGHAFAAELRPYLAQRTYENTNRISALQLFSYGAMTPKARVFLAELQDAQDAHQPWATALSMAKEYVFDLEEDGQPAA